MIRTLLTAIVVIVIVGVIFVVGADTEYWDDRDER